LFLEVFCYLFFFI